MQEILNRSSIKLQLFRDEHLKLDFFSKPKNKKCVPLTLFLKEVHARFDK